MEKPILFNTEMVKKVLEGSKTQTRRIIKNQPKGEFKWFGWVMDSTENKNIGCASWCIDPSMPGILHYSKPPYKIDDVLWVRETWLKADDGYHYKSDATNASEEIRIEYGYKWNPSIHMPRHAARIFLKVVNVKVERLQDISEEESLKEGLNEVPEVFTAKELFQATWNSIYKNWDENPWVWVIEIERV